MSKRLESMGVTRQERDRRDGIIRYPKITVGPSEDSQYDGLLLVTESSRKASREAVEQCARYLRLEMGYDSVPFSAGGLGHVQYEAWLMVDPVALACRSSYKDLVNVTGAALMVRKQFLGDPEPMWLLAWIWSHPWGRGQGRAESLMRALGHRYGAFHVEPPYSMATERLISKTRHQLHPSFAVGYTKTLSREIVDRLHGMSDQGATDLADHGVDFAGLVRAAVELNERADTALKSL